MADNARPEAGPPEPAAVREMGKRVAAHPDAAVKAIGAVLLAEMAAKNQKWVQLSNAEFQATTTHSEWIVRSRLALMEEQRIVRRQRRNGKPCQGKRETDRRGDFYAPAEVDEETAPARAGPMKKQPEEVTSPLGPQDGTVSPVRDAEPGKTNQP